MWYILLLIIITALLIGLFLFDKEIRKIAEQLDDLSDNRTRKKSQPRF